VNPKNYFGFFINEHLRLVMFQERKEREGKRRGREGKRRERKGR